MKAREVSCKERVSLTVAVNPCHLHQLGPHGQSRHQLEHVDQESDRIRLQPLMVCTTIRLATVWALLPGVPILDMAADLPTLLMAYEMVQPRLQRRCLPPRRQFVVRMKLTPAQVARQGTIYMGTKTNAMEDS